MRLTGIDLACQRGERGVFANVGFAVESGQALTISGRNGAGKSSLLRMIVGLLPIAAGRLAPSAATTLSAPKTAKTVSDSR